MTFIDWRTYAMCWAPLLRAGTSRVPEIGSSRPAIALSRVDFPDPFGPITAVTDPRGMAKVLVSTAILPG